MKSLKKILSLALAALLLTAVALPASAAELVERAELAYQRPFVGDKAGSLRPISADPEKYVIAVSSIYYFPKDANGNLLKDEKGSYVTVHLTDDDVFEEGIDYRIRFQFLAKSGYELNESTTVFVINSKEMKGSVGKYMHEDVFRARPESERPVRNEGGDLCPYCGEEHTGFFAFLVKFFHKILFRLGFKK